MISAERIYKILHEKNSVQRYISRKIFTIFQAIGFHVVGDHFYEIIPNTKFIEKHYKNQPLNLPFITDKLEETATFGLSIINDYGHEFHDAAIKLGYDEGNYYFRGVDALALYCFVRHIKPRRVIEVGQGSSTRVTMAALSKNYQDTNDKADFISIDPYSRIDFKDRVFQDVHISVEQREVQKTPLEIFSTLEDSDFLFIDSSHVYKFGSDVEFEFQFVYPNLKAGVYIHIHDICTPYLPPISWFTKNKWFWNEQAFLEAFLQFNDAFECLLPIHYLLKDSPTFKQACQQIAPFENFHIEGKSFYMRRMPV